MKRLYVGTSHDGLERVDTHELLLKRTKVVGSATDNTVTLPTTSGTVALTSEIPDNTDYVDLTTNQTISGTKTFSSAPVTSEIRPSAGQILTLPNATSTLVDTSSSQTLNNKTLAASTVFPTTVTLDGSAVLTTTNLLNVSNKTLVAPKIQNGELYVGSSLVQLPAVASTLVTENTSQALTNKSFTSLTNTFHRENYVKYGNNGSLNIGTGGAGTTLLTDAVWSGTQATLGTAISYSGGVMTINQGGVYLFTACAIWLDGNSGPRLLRLLSSTGQTFDSEGEVPTGAGNFKQSVCGVFVLSAGATVSVHAYQVTGAPRTIHTQTSPAHSFSGVMLFKI